MMMGTSDVQCQRPPLRESMLGRMVLSTLEGTRDMIGNIGRGMLRSIDPDGTVRSGGPARQRQRQRGGQQGGLRGSPRPQLGRVTPDDYYYDYENSEDANFNYYDYSASDELNNTFPQEIVPAPPNLPIRNNNIIRNNNNSNNNNSNNNNKTKNRFRKTGERFNRQGNNGPRQFNRPQVFNDIIQRSGMKGPFYPYPAYVGKK
ncbi:unnamed protein product [Meganyctiphanes norvegica]|uniref:Uncharacterized protein n=1 Tax=Meganyctiphanes norvegica TaxID=48144 RepID=A0AAV2RPE6_MEGNR